MLWDFDASTAVLALLVLIVLLVRLAPSWFFPCLSVPHTGL
ncbi:hypothetical protein [Paenibacillus chitinolyticus]